MENNSPNNWQPKGFSPALQEPPKDLFTQNPKLKSLLFVFMVVLLFSGVGLALFSYAQAIFREKLYYETEAGLPIHKEQKSTGGPSSFIYETDPNTVCQTNDDCWCRPFDGAHFSTGKAPSICNQETDRCSQCYYE